MRSQWVERFDGALFLMSGARAEIQLLFDEGPNFGLGHRRRMEALASALGHLGEGANTLPIGQWSDHLADDGGVVVVDAYSVRADEMRLGRCKVVAIDDLDRDLRVDLLVEPHPRTRNKGQPNRATRVLSGFEFALLSNPETSVDPVPVDAGTRVLVTMGGSDSEGRGARIIEGLVAAAPNADVVHAPGPWSVRSATPGVTVLEADRPLLAELAASHVVVCAGGVTALESLMLGRATVVVAIAENQRRAVAGIRDAGAALVVDDSTDQAVVVERVVQLVEQPDLRSTLSEAATVLVDGNGAARVAEAILELK